MISNNTCCMSHLKMAILFLAIVAYNDHANAEQPGPGSTEEANLNFRHVCWQSLPAGVNPPPPRRHMHIHKNRNSYHLTAGFVTSVSNR